MDVLTPSSTRPDASEIESQVIAPFCQDIRKPLTVLAHSNLTIQPGLRREDIPGNPVSIGDMNHPDCRQYQHLPCVKGDLDDAGKVFVVVQDRDWRGCNILESKKDLEEEVCKLDNFSEEIILQNLDIPGETWQEMIQYNVEELETIDDDEKMDFMAVREYFIDIFVKTVKTYIKQTILNARKEERAGFLEILQKPAGPNRLEGIRRIYERCGMDHLADMPAKKLVPLVGIAMRDLGEQGAGDFAGLSL